MTGLLDFPSPHVSAHGVRPFTVDELDAHPDRARIWATIIALRNEHWSLVDERVGEAEQDAFENGYQEGLAEGRSDIE